MPSASPSDDGGTEEAGGAGRYTGRCRVLGSCPPPAAFPLTLSPPKVLATAPRQSLPAPPPLPRPRKCCSRTATQRRQAGRVQPCFGRCCAPRARRPPLTSDQRARRGPHPCEVRARGATRSVVTDSGPRCARCRRSSSPGGQPVDVLLWVPASSSVIELCLPAASSCARLFFTRACLNLRGGQPTGRRRGPGSICLPKSVLAQQQLPRRGFG
jgi:hypothetical protein